MYDKILLPTDGSDVSERATEKAIELAQHFDAELHFVYVVAPIEHTTVEGNMTTEMNQLKTVGEEILQEETENALSKNVDSISSVLIGSPYKEIVHYADENDIDLIVMGTQGRSGAKRFLLGSTTERVIRHTDLEVLTVQ